MREEFIETILNIGGLIVAEREESIEPCCKSMAGALSFATGRHFFLQGDELKLVVANTPLLDGGDAGLEKTVRYCPFCGQPTRTLFEH